MSAAVSPGSVDAHEIQQQLHDGPLTAAIQPHKIPREVHRGAIPEIGEDFPGGCFTRGRTRIPVRNSLPRQHRYPATTLPLLRHYNSATPPLLHHHWLPDMDSNHD